MKCEVCGKGYQTRSGLRRHVKSVHGADAAPGEVVMKDQESEAGSLAKATMESRGANDEDLRSEPLREGCKALGIKLKDVMSFKVYDDQVVIIEGPTGWKRVWQRN